MLKNTTSPKKNQKSKPKPTKEEIGLTKKRKDFNGMIDKYNKEPKLIF